MTWLRLIVCGGLAARWYEQRTASPSNVYDTKGKVIALRPSTALWTLKSICPREKRSPSSLKGSFSLAGGLKFVSGYLNDMPCRHESVEVAMKLLWEGAMVDQHTQFHISFHGSITEIGARDECHG